MLLTLRSQFARSSSARATADAVISALSPAAWYRNATGVTSAGGFASQWDDYSGNGRHLVQAVGTKQPAYAAGVFTFDGVDNYFKTLAFTLSQPLTQYWVLQQVTWVGGDCITDGNTLFNVAIIQNDLTPEIRIYAGSNAADNNNLATGAYGIIACVFNGASSSLRVNNTAAITGNAGANAMNGLTLSASGDNNSCPNIFVKEGVIFGAAHDDATQSSVITALNNALTVF